MSSYAPRYCPSCRRYLGAADTCLFCRSASAAESRTFASQFDDQDGGRPIDEAVGGEAIEPSNPDWWEERPKAGLRGLRPTLLLLAAIGVLSTLPARRIILLALFLSQPVHLVFLIAILVAGLLAGMRRFAFAYGFSPHILVIHGKRFSFILGALLLGGYVKWPEEKEPSDENPRDAFRDGPHTSDSHGLRFQQLHPLVRVAICLAAPATTLLFSFVLLGTPALSSFSRAFEQSIGVLFRSTDANVAIIRPFLQRIADGDIRYVVGTIAAKHAATNLIPLGTTVGGMAMRAIWGWLTGRRLNKRISMSYEISSVFIHLIYGIFIAFVVLAALKKVQL
jgi:hypothetical protein